LNKDHNSYILANQQNFRNSMFSSLAKQLHVPDEMASPVAFGPGAVVW